MTSNIIGRFGVGFYSAFMVSDEITVYTRSAGAEAPGYCWYAAHTHSPAAPPELSCRRRRRRRSSAAEPVAESGPF